MFWEHEFRTDQGKPDFLYQNMMMCRDKSWLAVSRDQLTREELLYACLHDLLPGIIADEKGNYLTIELKDWASHGLYEHRFFEGTTSEKMEKMRSMLAKGQEVYVGTIHPLLPFSARYNPKINRESYRQPNHVFVILAEEAGRYVYFDTSSYKSPGFEPYPRNSELGWIEKKTVDAVLEQMFELAYIEWHRERRNQLKDYGRELLAAYAAEYDKDAGQALDQPRGTWYRGRRALEILRRHLTEESLNLAAASWEYDFVDQGDILNWKVTDLATRRRLMAQYGRQIDEEELAGLMEKSAVLYSRLSTFLLYRREKKAYGWHPRYGELLEQIMETEDKIYVFLQK